jgi:hypothetical protein
MVRTALPRRRESLMTDQNPVPTPRMPVPDPPDGGREETQGWSRSAESSDVERDVTPPLAGGPPPVPPVPPLAERRRRDETDHGRTASILFGLVILGLGLWFFAEHTLGYDLPRIQWNQVWPVTLIVIGLWGVLGSMRRGSR